MVCVKQTNHEERVSGRDAALIRFNRLTSRQNCVMVTSMKTDTRKTWEYNGCKITPVDCQHPTWGKCGTPILFKSGKYRNRYWRVNFPDGTFEYVESKSDARILCEYFGLIPQKRFVAMCQRYAGV